MIKVDEFAIQGGVGRRILDYFHNNGGEECHDISWGEWCDFLRRELEKIDGEVIFDDVNNPILISELQFNDEREYLILLLKV